MRCVYVKLAQMGHQYRCGKAEARAEEEGTGQAWFGCESGVERESVEIGPRRSLVEVER